MTIDFFLQVDCRFVHSLVGFGGFIPYFLLEAFGISLPYIGFTSIDSTYSWDGMTQLILFFAAIFLTVVCYLEYHGTTDVKVPHYDVGMDAMAMPTLLHASALVFTANSSRPRTY